MEIAVPDVGQGDVMRHCTRHRGGKVTHSITIYLRNREGIINRRSVVKAGVQGRNKAESAKGFQRLLYTNDDNRKQGKNIEKTTTSSTGKPAVKK